MKRQSELARQGFVSGANLTALRAQRDADEARVQELQARLRVARLGGREDAREAAQADALAAREALAQSQWRLTQKTVSAPVAARVEDTLYRVGEMAKIGVQDGRRNFYAPGHTAISRERCFFSANRSWPHAARMSRPRLTRIVAATPA